MNSTLDINKCLISNSNYRVWKHFSIVTMQYIPVARVQNRSGPTWFYPVVTGTPVLIPTPTTYQHPFAIVLDFETTCWESKTFKIYCNNEIIEFSCVLYCLRTRRVLSEFQQYVTPTEKPELSDFCKSLTGISQDQVNNGVNLAECLRLFHNWQYNQWLKYGINCDITTPYGNCMFVTWTDFDLGIYLEKECKRKNIYKSLIYNQWVNLKAIYMYHYGRKPKGLKETLNEVGLDFQGKQHSGLDDAKNTARLLEYMLRDNVRICITTKKSM